MYAWVWDHLPVAWLTYQGPKPKENECCSLPVIHCQLLLSWRREHCAHLPTVPECGLACSCAGLVRVVSAAVSSECGGPGMCGSHCFAPVFLNPWLLHSFHSLLYDVPKPCGIDVPLMTEKPTSVNCTSLLTEGSFFLSKICYYYYLRLFMLRGMYTCHGMCVEVKEPLLGVGFSFHHIIPPGDQAAGTFPTKSSP